MEFNILNPGEIESLPQVRWNFEDLKRYALEKAQEYKSIAYTEDDVKAMKSDRADINRFINAIEDERKKKKKEYMAPYTAFEDQVKEVLQPLREAEALIAKGLKEIDDRWKEERKQKVREIYNKVIGDLAEIVPFESVLCESQFKKSVSLKAIEESFTNLFDRVRSDLTEIEALPEKYQASALRAYKAGGRDLSAALAEVRRIQQDEAVIEERRKRQEELKGQVLKACESIDAEKERAQAKPAESNTQETQEASQDEEPILELVFKVRGTREQILALRDFMKATDIKFGRVG